MVEGSYLEAKSDFVNLEEGIIEVVGRLICFRLGGKKEEEEEEEEGRDNS